jgi:NAD(P)-dependent dehydrogenase (short-subunit alcohol dehydrogenase family)
MMLAGRTALVTGAGRRLGRAVAERLAARGARVAVHYRRSGADATSVIDGIRARGGEAEGFAADLADSAAIERLAGAVSERFGAVDILVNNAAVFYQTPLAALGEREWDENLTVNLKAPFLLSLRFGREMRTRGAGKIVNIGDGGASRPYRDYLPYCVSKAGLVALTRGLAKALAPEVQVNCVAPGPILPPAGSSAQQQASILRRTPLGRFGSPEDVEAAVLFLIEGSDFVTGTTLIVDGGRALA